MLKTFVRENSWLKFTDTGWGNGYVCLPVGHKYHGVGYNDIPVEVHGGLTFSEPAKDCNWPEIPEGSQDSWIIGFDTSHYGDTSSNWPLERVQQETENLANQLMA